MLAVNFIFTVCCIAAILTHGGEGMVLHDAYLTMLALKSEAGFRTSTAVCP